MICPPCLEAGEWLTLAAKPGNVRDACLRNATHAHQFCDAYKGGTWCDCRHDVPESGTAMATRSDA